jgi:hypothetical protein
VGEGGQVPKGEPESGLLLRHGGPDAGLPPGGGRVAVVEVQEPDEKEGDRRQQNENENDVRHAGRASRVGSEGSASPLRQSIAGKRRRAGSVSDRSEAVHSGR